MAEKKPGRQLGPTGETVRANIRAVRDSQRISGAELSARLTEIDRPIPPLGIQRIESGSRRVDVDDLAAIAVALNVSPATLLMPHASESDEAVHATGVTSSLPALNLWFWLIAAAPLTGGRHAQLDFLTKAVPKWIVDNGDIPVFVESGTGPSLATHLRLPSLERDDGHDK